MRPIRMMVTAIGAPGSSTLLRHLRNNGERKIEIIGCDVDPYCYGRYLVDRFEQVPYGLERSYISVIRNLILKYNVELLFPVSSMEVVNVAMHQDDLPCRVLVSDYEGTKTVSNKNSLYMSRPPSVPVPRHFLVTNEDDRRKAVAALGYPVNRVVAKLLDSKGSRGLRFFTSKEEVGHAMVFDKTSYYMTYESFEEALSALDEQPPYLFMEEITGVHYDCMVLADKGEALLVTVKERQKTRNGVITYGTLVRNDVLEEYCRLLVDQYKLSYNISIQFIEDKLIEINPRTSSYVYTKTLNEPYLAVKLALGELSPNKIKEYARNVPFGYSLLRYQDQITVSPVGVQYVEGTKVDFGGLR